MILSCSNIDKTFIDNHVIKNASFHIEDYEKAAIVGINGAGKSTLLKIITGSLPADDGLVTFAKDKTYGYLAQQQAVNSEHTIYDELLTVKQEVLDLEASIRETELAMKTASDAELELLLKKYTDMNHRFELLNGYAYKSEVTGILKGLGFQEEEFQKKVDTLSGGQKTRIALGKLLLQKPDLIILDEPTNHLDLNSIAWLETYLLNYKGAVLIVSHDRYFLDKIATKIIEIDNGNVMVFHGNYSDYARQKEVLRTEQLNAYLNQQREIKHQEEVIDKLRSFNREKSIKRAESREKMLDKIERIDKPTEVKADMKLKLTPRLLSGNDVLSVSDLSKAYDGQILFSNASFEVKRGEHVAIIGDNGTGKTTLLKIINELVPPDTGSIKLGSNVQIGYYDQEHHVLHMDKTLFEEISDDYPDLTNTQIRNTLAAFLFTGEDVFKKISSLSGGERGRVSLAKLMLSESNFLILDEPTNHLDITSKEILESALNAYEGTVLYVSHDRYFVRKVANRLLVFEDGTTHLYQFGYEEYQEKLDREAAESGDDYRKNPAALGGAISQNGGTQQSKGTQETGGKKAYYNPGKERSKIEKKVKKAEEELAVKEEKLDALKQELLRPEYQSSYSKLTEIQGEIDALEEEIMADMENWEALSQQLEELEG